MAYQYRYSKPISDYYDREGRKEMHSKNNLSAVGNAIFVFAALGYAGIGSRESVITLTNSADAVVVATIEAISAGGSVNASLHVERVLKGTVLPGDTVSFAWSPVRGPLPGNWSSMGHGLVFLRQSSRGLWTLLPATQGDVSWEDMYIVTATPESFVPDPRRTDAGSLRELRLIVEASLPQGVSAFDTALAELVLTVEAGVPVPIDLPSTFREKPSPVLAAAFGRFRSRQHPLLRSLGLRGSLAAGDPSALRAVHQDYAVLSAGAGWLPIVQEIKFYYLNTSPDAILALGAMAVDANIGTDLRAAAATALAKMHAKQTLPYLVQLLDQESVSLKAAAVGGMAGFANNVPIGSHEPAAGAWPYRTEETIAHSVFDEKAVRQREAYYVDFWHNWWLQNQNSLLQH